MTQFLASRTALIGALGVIDLALLLGGIHLLVEAVSLKLGRGTVVLISTLCGLLVTMACLINAIELAAYDNTAVLSWIPSSLLDPPAFVFVAPLVACALCEAAFARRLSAFRKTTLSADSVKEALDALPDAALFSSDDGRILLRNVRATELALRPNTTPGLLQDNKGRMWQLTRTQIELTHGAVNELVAVDVSEEYELVRELERRNALLKEVNARLRSYGASLVTLTREEEVLATKMYVHDELGRALVALRAYEAQDPSERNREALLDIWHQSLMLLRTAAIPEARQPDSWILLEEAARAINVQLIVEGDVPTEARTHAAIVALVHECLSNAVRHGGAHEVTVQFLHEEGWLRVVVSNDGRQPEGPMAETGGLANVRKVIERADGTMDVQWTPRLTVTASFESEGEGNA